MKTKLFVFCLFTASFAFLWPVTVPTSVTAAVVPEWKIPAAAQGFLGTLSGEVVSKIEGENTFVLKVKGIANEARESKAKKSAKLKGEKALIFINNNFKDGKMTPDETQIQFIKEVKKGAKLEVAVRSDGNSRLRMTEVPKVIKK